MAQNVEEEGWGVEQQNLDRKLNAERDTERIAGTVETAWEKVAADSVGENSSGEKDGDGEEKDNGACREENSKDVEVNGKHVEDSKGDSEDSKGEQENGRGVSVPKSP
jgi:hypothetical protein